MPRTRFIEHEGRKILLLDFSSIGDPQLALDAIAEARAIIARQQPDGSLLTLTNVTGSHFDSGVLRAIRELAEHNRPYVRAGAVTLLARNRQLSPRIERALADVASNDPKPDLRRLAAGDAR